MHSGLDCDDTDEDVYPNATELCDGIDNQCPGDSKGHGMVDTDAACLCSFDGGGFIFTVGEVVDNCPVFDIASLFPPGGRVGPVELPGFQDLRETIIPFGPPIGTVPVSMFSRGKNIRFELRINATATLIGVFNALARPTRSTPPLPLIVPAMCWPTAPLREGDHLQYLT